MKIIGTVSSKITLPRFIMLNKAVHLRNKTFSLSSLYVDIDFGAVIILYAMIAKVTIPHFSTYECARQIQNAHNIIEEPCRTCRQSGLCLFTNCQLLITTCVIPHQYCAHLAYDLAVTVYV